MLWRIDVALESIINAAKSVLRDAVSPSSNNPASDRVDVLQDLHLAEKAWATDGVRSSTWFVRDGEHVAFTPTIPADRFADYLVNMRSAIEAGEFDREIAGALHGSANVGGTAEVAVPDAREGSPDDVRQAQQVAALAREGRNPDGSLATIVRDGS
jgi:hypothetical protein